jgi:PAS domain S-box-containing protein
MSKPLAKHTKMLTSNRYVLAFLIISVIISIVGYSYLQEQKKFAVKEANLDLSTIVDLKVSQLVQWRKERLLEANSIYSNPMIAHRILEYLHGIEKARTINEIHSWLLSQHNVVGKSRLTLFKPDGGVISSVTNIAGSPTRNYRDLVATTSKKREVLLSDFHLDEETQAVSLDLSIPIIHIAGKQSDCIAVLIIEIDPYIALYPLIRFWPTPSRTGETVLVRRDGNEVLFLNELRDHLKSAVIYRRPLTDRKMPEVRAALGNEGVFEGVDYRGVKVLSAVRSIPDTPWAIIAKVDTTEVLEPVTEHVWYVIGTCLVFLIALGLAGSLLWRRKRESYFFAQYESELKYNSELKQVEQALLEANNRLEERVERRTEELSTAIVHLKQEIAERKQVEDLLRKQFQAILQSPVAIIITDLDGIIEFVNPKFTEYSGYSYEEAIGQNPRFLKTADTPSDFYKNLWETITSGNVWEGEICNKKKNGELYWEHSKILPIKNQEGIITNFMAFKEDITRHKLLEEKLIRSRKLKTIGQIAGGVAHEVRNPLNAILSITEALFKEKEIEGNPEFEPYIQHIRTQVNRLAHIMNELLDLGKTIPTSSIHSVPLYEVCQEAIDLWNSSGSAQKIPVILETDSDPAQTDVMADRGRLVQIIMNLLENAAQHSPGNGKLVFQIIYSTVPAAIRNRAIIRITDQGHGIPPETLPRVFDPFFTDRKGGIGLGLALVKHFIEDMSGSVLLFNNDPAPGCTAEIQIPKTVENQV